MLQIFDLWNETKKQIHIYKEGDFHVKQREIWSVNMGVNIGFEENGKGENFERPVLVIKKIGVMYLCVSMTTKGKDNNFYYELPEDISGKKSYLILSQPKLLDIKRFHYKISMIHKDVFMEIKEKLKTLWF